MGVNPHVERAKSDLGDHRRFSEVLAHCLAFGEVCVTPDYFLVGYTDEDGYFFVYYLAGDMKKCIREQRGRHPNGYRYNRAFKNSPFTRTVEPENFRNYGL